MVWATNFIQTKAGFSPSVSNDSATPKPRCVVPDRCCLDGVVVVWNYVPLWGATCDVSPCHTHVRVIGCMTSCGSLTLGRNSRTKRRNKRRTPQGAPRPPLAASSNAAAAAAAQDMGPWSSGQAVRSRDGAPSVNVHRCLFVLFLRFFVLVLLLLLLLFCFFFVCGRMVSLSSTRALASPHVAHVLCCCRVWGWGVACGVWGVLSFPFPSHARNACRWQQTGWRSILPAGLCGQLATATPPPWRSANSGCWCRCRCRCR